MLPILLTLALASSAAQRGPDPTLDLPRDTWEIPSEPYFSGIMIGPMHRPAGSLRTVRWYQDGVFGDDSGWELRIVQRFDHQGRCIEVESWAMGIRENVSTVEPGSLDKAPQRLWDLGSDRCARTRSIRGENGQEIAVVREELDHLGQPLKYRPPRIVREHARDARGRIVESTHSDADDRFRAPTRVDRWSYDLHGRIREHATEHCRRGTKLRTGFLYFPDGRVRARIVDSDDGAPDRTDYEYDAAGRVVAETTRTGGTLAVVSTCAYDAEGRLAIRQVLDLRIDAMRNHPTSTLVVETFAGVDRPLTSEVFDASGRSVAWGEASYVDDERGNWVLKRSIGYLDHGAELVRREIEYAD